MICTACNEDKLDTEFYFRKETGKLRRQCKICLMARHNPNKENRRKLHAKYYAKNSMKYRQRCQQWRQKNLAYDAYRSSCYRALKARRTPLWADKTKIKQFYLNCPEGYHVDHIIPLRGTHASGLHVETNLQYLPALENLRKRNLYGW